MDYHNMSQPSNCQRLCVHVIYLRRLNKQQSKSTPTNLRVHHIGKTDNTNHRLFITYLHYVPQNLTPECIPEFNPEMYPRM